MRYTEIRMARLAEELLADIEKETVDFIPNYDDSLKEPAVLPSRVPNLLVNGASGIAVGMAYEYPAAQPGEVIDGLVALVENPDLTIKQLMKYIPGPDFPTGGFIHGKEPIAQAYNERVKALIQMRGKAFTETVKRTGKEQIVISEIPFMVNRIGSSSRLPVWYRRRKLTESRIFAMNPTARGCASSSNSSAMR